jgi:hypothetical protein
MMVEMVTTDNEGIIHECDDPKNPDAWFLIVASGSRPFIYNGNVARTILGGEEYMGRTDLSNFIGLPAPKEYEFKPDDNDAGLELIKRHLSEHGM